MFAFCKANAAQYQIRKQVVSQPGALSERLDCCMCALQIQLMCTYLTKAEYKELQEVPDPYFGGEEGFEKVRNLLTHV